MIIGNSIEEVAKSLRNMAELTAKASQNWDNYEQIVLDVLRQVVLVSGEQKS